MAEPTGATTHYIVHATCADPPPQTTYGTSPPYTDLGLAIKAAHCEIGRGRRAFVTARDDRSGILAVIPVVDYPVAGETRVREQAQDAISALFEAMDWTI